MTEIPNPSDEIDRVADQLGIAAGTEELNANVGTAMRIAEEVLYDPDATQADVEAALLLEAIYVERAARAASADAAVNEELRQLTGS